MRNRTLTLATILANLCLASAPTPVMAGGAPLCEHVLASPGSVQISFAATGEWRKTEGNLFSAVRANAPHNWAYFKTLRPHLVSLREAFKVEGIGIGDFHILNVGDIELSNGSRKIGLIDIDDGGHTSLFADFVRSAISNQVSPYKVPLHDLWKNYLDGLKDEKIQKPKIIETILAKSHSEYLANQKKYLDKIIDGKGFSTAAGVRPLSEMDPVTRDVYVESIGAMINSLGNVKILAQAFKIKDTGGSQGIPRFWFLVEHKGARTVIELKTLAEPAMNLYEQQGSQQDRINSLIEFYRPQRSTFGFYRFVDGGKYQFIARERTRGFLALDPEGKVSGKDIQEGQDVYRYLAQRAGKWHSDQGQGEALFKALTLDEAKSYAEFESVVNDYIEVMKRENGSEAQKDAPRK